MDGPLSKYFFSRCTLVLFHARLLLKIACFLAKGPTQLFLSDFFFSYCLDKQNNLLFFPVMLA